MVSRIREGGDENDANHEFHDDAECNPEHQ